jgi:hypothetical protein
MSGIATAMVGSAVVGGYMSSKAQEGAAETAAGAQQASTEASIAEQRRQFDAMQELLAPYVAAGEPAIQQMGVLAGLGAPGEQQAAIAAIEQSPLFQAQVRQGEEALLQQASATGGLRGGNIQAALAQYRPQMLQQALETQYNRLAGLGQMGQASAAGQAAQGMQSAADIGNLLQQSGQAQAQAALASGQAQAQMWGNIAGSIGTVAGMSKGSFGKF